MGEYSKEIIVGNGIAKLDGRCGGSACVKGTRMAVWFLVSIMSRGLGSWDDEKVLYNYPHLKQIDLENVIGYWMDNQDEIAQEIKDDEVEDEIIMKESCEENHLNIQNKIKDRGAVKIDITKSVFTRSGKRVIGLQYVPYNSAGGLVTYPIKGTIILKEKPKMKTKYAIWSEDGISDVVWGKHEDEDIINREN